jgi:hypothetical protein
MPEEFPYSGVLMGKIGNFSFQAVFPVYIMDIQLRQRGLSASLKRVECYRVNFENAMDLKKFFWD